MTTRSHEACVGSLTHRLCALDKDGTHVQVFRLCTAQGHSVLWRDAISIMDMYRFIRESVVDTEVPSLLAESWSSRGDSPPTQIHMVHASVQAHVPKSLLFPACPLGIPVLTPTKRTMWLAWLSG